jgi:polysaccharide export outer membrane protein
VSHFAKAAAGEAASTNAADQASLKPRLISPGMQFGVTVAEDASLNRIYQVPPGCTVEIAGAGRVNVCGLTSDELAQKIREPLERDYFQKATVSVSIESSLAVEKAGGVVYVIGDVNRPGPLLLPKDEVFTVTKVIIAAGGFTQFAKSGAVRLIRYGDDGRKYETTIDVARIMKAGEFENDVPVVANDWIIVPQKFISF